tara:strand:- start:796 stop:2082 length:1287 start_codon:yes stop_codon:yes gene_type:complete
MPRTDFFVITPEAGTDATMLAMRLGWMSTLPSERVHFCVANNTDSRQRDINPTLLVLESVRRSAETPRSRDDYFHARQLGGKQRERLKELYNSFLRLKVLAMLREMARRAESRLLDYAFMLDYDTATNSSNLDAFVAALPGAGDRPIYTGRCVQEPLMAAGTTLDASRRQEVAWYINLAQRASKQGAPAPQWDPRTPPSPGGGPGLLFSRGLLTQVQRRLDSCAHLAWPGAMGGGIYTGGDSMITRCFASFGFRCDAESDLGLDAPGVCPLPHGCSLLALFRKNPPWFYFAAKRFVRDLKAANESTLSKARQQIVRAYDTDGRRIDGATTGMPDSQSAMSLHVPLDATISFHHVKPTARSLTYRQDPRCGVRLKSKNAAHVGWWASKCLPYVFVLGTPKAATSTSQGMPGAPRGGAATPSPSPPARPS